MKNITLLLLNILCSQLAFGQWQTNNINTSSQISSVWSTNSTTVFACNLFEKIYRSNDSGKNWSTIYQSSTLAYFRDMQFSNDNNGVVVGDDIANFLFLHTSNGGNSWNQVKFPTNTALSSVNCIDFASQNIAYAAGTNGKVFKSTNSGAAWSMLNTNFTNEDIVDIDATNVNVIFVTTFFGSVFKSIDGGSTWVANNTILGNRCQFLTEQIGFIFTGLSLLKTENGGTSWQNIGEMPLNTRDFQMLDANIGFAITNDGKIFKTANGGLLWVSQYTDPTANTLYDIHFFNAQKGYVAILGSNPSILRTENQGGIAAEISLKNLRLNNNNKFCQGDTIQLEALAIGATTFSWKVNGLQISTKQKDIYILNSAFFNSIQLQVNGNSQVIDLKQDIDVKQVTVSTLNVSSGLYGPCEMDSVTLTIKNIEPFASYFIRHNNTILIDNLHGFDSLKIPLPKWSGTQKLEIWLKDQGCGTRKIAEHSIFFQKKPLDKLTLIAVKNPICENTEAQIKVSKPENGVFYQIFKDKKPFGAETSNNQSSLTLDSKLLQKTAYLHVRASRTPGCNTILKDSVLVLVKELPTYFSLTSDNIGLGEKITIANNSPDSLSSKWNFGSDATPPTSSVKTPSTFFYNTLGVKNINLEVTSPSGCQKSVAQNIAIYDTVGLKKNWVSVQNTRPNPWSNLDKLAVDNQGNIYTTGNTDSDYRIFSNAGNGFSGKISEKRLLIKHNSDGVYQWHLKFEKSLTIKGISMAKNQNIYVLFSKNSDKISLPSRDNRQREIDENTNIIVAVYSSLGTIENIYQIQNNCALSKSLEAISLNINDAGLMTVAGQSITNCDSSELILKLNNGNILKKKYAYNWNYFLLDFLPNGTSFNLSLHQNGQIVGQFVYSLLPQKILNYNNDEIFVLASGEKNDQQQPKIAQIVKLDKQRKRIWAFNANIAIQTGNGNYVFFNDMALTKQGDVAVIGTIFGSVEFLPFTLQSVAAVTISLIDGKTGKLKWHRYLSTPNPSDFPPPTQPGLGITVAGNKIFAKARYDGIAPSIHSTPYCLNFNTDPNNEFIFKMDTIGNLLKVSGSKVSIIAQDESQVASTIVFDGKQLYSIGNADAKGKFEGISYNVANGGTYIARIKDDQDYLPFITTPYIPAPDYNCELSICSANKEKLQISPIFTKIKWKKDNNVLPNETKSIFFPTTSGTYSVEATSPNGKIATSPQGIKVSVSPSPDAKLTNKKDTIIAVFYKNAYYTWQDTSNAIIASGTDLNKVYTTSKSPIKVSISAGACNATSEFYTKKITNIKEDVLPSEIIIAPNPTNGDFNISFLDEQKGFIQIFNALGQNIYENQFELNEKWNVELKNKEKGLFTVVISIKNKVLVKKIIVL